MTRLFRSFTVAALTATALGGCSYFDNDAAAAREAALAQSRLEAGVLGGAKRHIIEAIAKRDDVAEYWVLRARIAAARGDSSDAYNSLRTAMALDKSNVDVLRGLVQLGGQIAQPVELDTFADQLSVMSPGDPQIPVAHGYAAMNRGDYAKAMSFVDESLQASPDNTNALVLKSQVLRRQRKFDEAAATIWAASQRVGTSPGMMEALSTVYQQAGDRAGYERAVKGMVEASPKSIDASLTLADVLYQNGDRDGARALVNKVVAANPKTGDLPGKLTALWLKQPDALTPEEIVTDGQAASPLLRTAYARHAIAVGRPDLAVQILGTTPDLPDAQAVLARALAAQGKAAEAKQLADKVLAADQDNPQALLARGSIAWRRGNASGAVSSVRQAIVQDGNDEVARIMLARYLQGRGDTVLAVGALRDGLAANPRSLPLAVALTKLLVTQGKRAEAAGVLNEMAVNARLDTRAIRFRAALCPLTGSDSCERPVRMTDV